MSLYLVVGVLKRIALEDTIYSQRHPHHHHLGMHFHHYMIRLQYLH